MSLVDGGGGGDAINRAYVRYDPDVVGIESNGFGLTMVVAAMLGLVAMAAGALGQFVVLIGALLNCQDKTWFCYCCS